MFIFCFSCESETKQIRLTGAIFGTTYSIIYQGNESYNENFLKIFESINNSLSTYIPSSIISNINKNKSDSINEHIKIVFDEAKLVYEKTNGSFDPTIGSVVNAWDFGPRGAIKNLDSIKISELMKSVGFDKININGYKIKKPINTFLDFNAIAKGYAVDVISQFLISEGVNDFLVEIGGEIRCSGLNKKREFPWVVGIQNPDLSNDKVYFKKVNLNNESMATSGTYRKYKIDKNGKRYTHIIDTKNGYPSRTNILSVSVITKRCMAADAYATALQTMPLDRLEIYLNDNPKLKVFVIYQGDNEDLEFKTFNGFSFY